MVVPPGGEAAANLTVAEAAKNEGMTPQQFLANNTQYSKPTDIVKPSTEPVTIVTGSPRAVDSSKPQQQQAPQTLAAIAEEHGVSVAQLKEANKALAKTDENAPLPTSTRVVVPPRGDAAANLTVADAAKNEGMTPEQFLANNPQYSKPTDVVKPSSEPVTIVTASARESKKQEQAPAPQTLASIAAEHGVTVEQLKESNKALRATNEDAPLPTSTRVVVPPRGEAAANITVAEAAKNEGMTTEQFQIGRASCRERV